MTDLQKLPTEAYEQPAREAQALADLQRLVLAQQLRAEGELTVTALCCGCGCAQSLASHHLRVLREAGLAVGQRNGREMRYSLTPRAQQLLGALLPVAESKTPVQRESQSPEDVLATALRSHVVPAQLPGQPERP